MNHPTLTQRVLTLGLLAVVLLAGCMTPPRGGMGQPISQNDVSVTVTSAELMYLDLEGPAGGVQTDAPLLAVRLHVTNASPEPVRYDLAWGASAATQAQAALLFVNPGAETSPTLGTPISRALLNTMRYVEDPVAEARTIAPGENIEDVLLFEAPPADATSLVLSVPPGVFGPAAKMPAYIDIPYTQADPAAPGAVPMGTAFAGDGFSYVVDAATVVWPRLRNTTNDEAGFSTAPLLKIDFTINNTSDATIEYIPAAASNRFHPPVLQTDAGSTVARSTFAAGIVPEGALTERKQIGPGESYSGFMLFERPAAEVSNLRLVVAAARLGSHGLIRVDVPYTFADPAQPDELTPQVIDAPQ